MQIYLNGQAQQCPPTSTVLDLLQAVGYAERRVAVEVNRELVPRSQLGAHALNEGDRVEIIQAIGGG